MGSQPNFMYTFSFTSQDALYIDDDAALDASPLADTARRDAIISDAVRAAIGCSPCTPHRPQ